MKIFKWILFLTIVANAAIIFRLVSISQKEEISQVNLIAIQDAENEEQLKKVYLEAYKACGTDKNWQKKMIAAKDQKKASL